MPSIRVNRAPIRDVNRVGPALLIIMERYSTRFAWLEGSRVISIMFLVFLFISGIAARQHNFGFWILLCVKLFFCRWHITSTFAQNLLKSLKINAVFPMHN